MILTRLPVGGGGGNSNCYKIKTKGCGKILDIAGGSTSNGAKLIQWSGNDQLNQRFSFEHLGNSTYKIIVVYRGICLRNISSPTMYCFYRSNVTKSNW